MTFQEFLTRWNGSYVDTDGAYGGQCMDLMHQYCLEVLGLSLSDLAAPSAKQVFVNFENVTGHDHFEKILNTPEGVPQEGDVMFWINDPYGHVAVFVEGDANSFRSFDQNYPTGSPCHVQSHTYANVGGWLRFKGSSTLQAQLDQCHIDRDSHWNDRQAIAEKLHVQNSMDVIMAELDKFLTLEDKFREKEKQNEKLSEKAESLSKQLATATEDYRTLDANYTASQHIIEENTGKLETLTKQTKQLQEDIKSLTLTPTEHIIKGFRDLFRR